MGTNIGTLVTLNTSFFFPFRNMNSNTTLLIFSCTCRESPIFTTRESRNRKIITIEGLDPSGNHPVQKAWNDEDVPQCGYCQGGQILAATALLAEKPNPDDNDIDEAMSGILCRCGTYQRIRKAIKRAAEYGSGRGGDV